MKKELKPLIFISLFFIVYLILFKNQCSNMIIDFSRESYIPYQMTQGKALVKDIFLIYGSFGYIFNFFVYKIFGVNFNFLIYEAIFTGFCFVTLYYFISRQFLKQNESLVLAISAVAVNIFSSSTFNFIVPYSYSTLWGYFGAYSVLYCLLKKKYSFLFLALGFICVNKIELFIPLLFVSAFYSLKDKKALKNIIYIFIFPALNIIYFIFSKVSPADFSKNFYYLKAMTQTHALKYFYSHVGVFFNKAYFLYSLKNILIFSLIAFVSYVLFVKNKKILSALFAICALYLCFKPDFSNLAIILLIYPILFLIFKKKKIKQKEQILLLFSLILCLKGIFAINYFNYTNFGFPLFFLALFAFYKKIIPFKARLWLLMLVIFIAFCLIKDNINFMKKNYQFKTTAGTLYLEDKLGNEKLLNFLNNSLKNNQNILIIPEGQIFNLIYQKPYRYYYSTFTPLDFETFKEDKIINDLAKNKPDYIIFYPRNTKEYGSTTICYDYAVNFCTYIMENYFRIGIIEGQYKTLIFKKK